MLFRDMGLLLLPPHEEYGEKISPWHQTNPFSPEAESSIGRRHNYAMSDSRKQSAASFPLRHDFVTPLSPMFILLIEASAVLLLLLFLPTTPNQMSLYLGL